MFVRVNARVYNAGEAREVWYVFETPHASMADFHEAMIRDGQVFGTRYETERMPGTRAGRQAYDSYELILHRDGFTSIAKMRDDLFDLSGDPIFSLEEARAQ